MGREERKTELIDLIQSAENGYNAYSGVFDELSKAYLMKMDSGLKDNLTKRNKSSLYFPATNAKVKRKHAAFQGTYFSTDDLANILPNTGSEQDQRAAEALQDALFFYINKKMNAYQPMSKQFLDVIVYGTNCPKVYWRGDSPLIEHVRIDDVCYDPGASSYEDLRYLVNNIYVTKQDIRRLKRERVYSAKFNLDDIQTNVTDSIVSEDSYSRVKLQDIYTLTDKGWTVSTFYDQSVALRVDIPVIDGLPFFPGQVLPQMTQPAERNSVMLYGDSTVAPLIELQQEMNMRRNQMVDAISLQLNPRFITQVGSGINPMDLRRGAGTIISANNINGVRELDAPQIATSAGDLSQLSVDMQEAFGITDYNSGINSDKLNSTATGVSILTQEANVRLESEIKAFNETCFEPMIKHIAKLIWKYGDNRFFAGVNRQRDFDFTVRINTGLGATSKDVKLNGLTRAFEMFMSIQDAENARQVIKDTLPILGIKNTSKYFPENGNETNAGNGQQPSVDDQHRGLPNVPEAVGAEAQRAMDGSETRGNAGYGGQPGDFVG